MNLITYFKHARNTVTVPAGRAIFTQGNRGTVMYVLVDGMADVLVHGELVERALPGTLFGEMALIDDSCRSASAVARTDCRLVPIPQEQFDLLVRETPEFARHVMAAMAERLRRMNEKMIARSAIELG